MSFDGGHVSVDTLFRLIWDEYHAAGRVEGRVVILAAFPFRPVTGGRRTIGRLGP